MRKSDRLTQSYQYGLVYRKGVSWVNNLLVMRALNNGGNPSRYGLTITKRMGKAVIRNRLKRRLREIMRTTTIKPGWDIVLITRSAITSASFNEIKQATMDLLSRAQLLEKKNETLCLKTN
jgi:ribonuclease P protein component